MRWLRKKFEFKAPQIPWNDAYSVYAAMTRDAAQRRNRAFYDAINFTRKTAYQCAVNFKGFTGKDRFFAVENRLKRDTLVCITIKMDTQTNDP
jgi:hypothetical protein